jgi:hypothetical protein
MKEIRILALGTILVLGFAMGAQAQSETTSEHGDANNYQVGQPTSAQDESAIGDANSYEIGQPDQQATPESEQQAPKEDPAPLGNVSLSPDTWSVPPSL